MRSSIRTTRWFAIAVATGCVMLVTALATATPAANSKGGLITAGHRCLVMTGAGDPTFTKNFNPYTATGQPSGAFVQGAFYEPLIITGEGGLKPVPWLARSWRWSNGNKTLTLNIARGVRWSHGQRLDSADVVYSITAGKQDKLMDRVGLVLKKFATSLTLDQTCCGTTNCRFTVAAMNCESGVFSLMTTLYAPAALTDVMLLPAPTSPTRSMSLSCRPAVRL